MSDEIDDREAPLVGIIRVALLIVAAMLLVGLGILTCGCASSSPCPPPPDPLLVPYPVIQPTEPPPPLETPHCRVCELPDDATRNQRLSALALDLADERAARVLRDRILDIYRQKAGVPMNTTADPHKITTPN